MNPEPVSQCSVLWKSDYTVQNSSYFSASQGNKRLFSVTADAGLGRSFHRELCEDRQYDRTENRAVMLCHRARVSPCSPSRWDFMEVLAPGKKSQCISPGRNTAWLSSGKYRIQGKRCLDQLGGLGWGDSTSPQWHGNAEILAVHSSEWCACGYTTLITTTSVGGDLESTWWSPRYKAMNVLTPWTLMVVTAIHLQYGFFSQDLFFLTVAFSLWKPVRRV